MISNLRFDGHGVFAGVYDAAAHYYALHLVCHLEATVVGGVVCFGELGSGARYSMFRFRANDARRENTCGTYTFHGHFRAAVSRKCRSSRALLA
jgi:hypothetical protein